MIPRIPVDAAARAQRKANLLLASELLRGQTTLAADDLGQRADVLVRRLLSWRAVLTSPIVLAVAGSGAALLAGAGQQRRGKLWRGLHWAWLAYKTWGVRGRR